MGLFAYAVAGGGILLVGAWESLAFSAEDPKPALSSPPSPPQSSDTPTKTPPSSPPVTFLSISLLSLFSLLYSVASLSDALNSKDKIGSALQLQVISVSLLFLLYSVLGLLSRTNNSFQFPPSILNLICLFAFVEEFLLFYLQRKDTSGIENRYYDLMLVPISVCAFSTLLELKSPGSFHTRFGRGIGLILQGMWILQMGFSFFSNLVANGCSVHLMSRGNYTVRCKGHPEYHRGRAIATLQFNCHLAFLVVLISGVYSVVCKKHGISREFMRYRPLGAEMQQLEMDGQSQFTLDSDDDGDDEKGFGEDRNVEMQKAPQSVANGHGVHH